MPRTRLETLIEGFDRDTSTGREAIRVLMERDPQAFQEGVVPVLRSCSSARGIQYMVGLLAASSYLFDTLCDPALTLDEAIMLTRTALQVDQLADVNIAKRLADDGLTRLSSSAAGRLMEVLDTVSDGNRLMPSLLRLMRVADPQIRSKAVLMIGRASRSVQWVRSRLSDPDPRTRASAVEALWGTEGADVRDLLRAASNDSNNRVAGNALFALYGMGETSTISDLLKMAAAPAAMFRATAAWAMGETGDRRFADVLARMMCDTNSVVRKRAFTALGRVRSAAAKARVGREYRVAGRVLPSIGGVRQVIVEVSSPERGLPPKLVATQFVLSESGQVVYSYQVEDRTPPESLAVSFLLPRTGAMQPAAQGALNALAGKRTSDLWRAVYYKDGGGSPESPLQLPPFSSIPKTVATGFEKQPHRSDCCDLWGTLEEAVKVANHPTRGARRLIVYCPQDPGAPPDAMEIAAVAVSGHVGVHVISAVPSGPLEDLSRRTRGSFQLAAAEEDLPRQTEDAYQLLLARYLVTYQSATPNANSIDLWVGNATGWGETSLTL
jgi:hypothetical protein